jgi:hypothetical protein
MGLFDALFGKLESGQRRAGAADDAVLREALERAVEVVEPRLKILPRYADRLRPALQTAVSQIRGDIGAIDAVHDASAQGWSSDPVVRATFARPADIAPVFSRAREVQRWFRSNPAATEVYAALGMSYDERQVLAPALVDGAVRQDVMRRQVLFGDHRVAFVGGSDDELRRAVGRAVFNQLLLNAAEALSGRDKQRKQLELTRSLLQARLRMLRHQESPLSSALEGDGAADPTVEIRSLEDALARSTEAAQELGGGPDALDRALDMLANVLSHPAEGVQVSRERRRVDEFNNMVEVEDGVGADIEFTALRIASEPPRTRAAVLMRFARADLGRGGLAIDEVAATL